MTWGGNIRENIQIHRYGVRRAKVYLEIKLAEDAQGKTKCSTSTSAAKGRRENVGLLLNRAGVLVTKDPEKTGVLSAFFASVFIDKTCIQESCSSQTCRRKSGARKTYTWWRRIRLGNI